MRWCMACHVIEREPPGAAANGVPSFSAIAAKSSTTADSLDQYLSTGHTRMPDFSLSRDERNALIAYILSLRYSREHADHPVPGIAPQLCFADADRTARRMSRLRLHPESHLVERIGWLRAAVLGANDGIVSTASLIVGVAAAATAPNDVLIAGVAGLVAGAMSMAAGEYVSVSSQADTEHADLARETRGAESQSRLRARRAERNLCPARGRARPGAAGGRAVDGDGRPGGARPRRARDFRRHHRAPAAGRPHLGRDLLGRRRHAAAHGRGRARRRPRPGRLRGARSSSSRCWGRSARAPAAPMSGARRRG